MENMLSMCKLQESSQLVAALYPPPPGLRSFCARRRSWLSIGRWPMSLMTAS